MKIQALSHLVDVLAVVDADAQRFKVRRVKFAVVFLDPFDCVVIENDGKEKSIKTTKVDNINAYSKEGFVEILKNCAVTGMGGSDFPTFIKYNSSSKDRL